MMILLIDLLMIFDFLKKSFTGVLFYVCGYFFSDSYVSKTRVSMLTHLLLLSTFFWLGSVEKAAKFLERSERWVAHYFRFFRRCIGFYMTHFYYPNFRFDPRYPIQWDESAIGRRKHNRGRRRTPHWILSGIQHENGLATMHFVRRRTAAHLIPVIRSFSNRVQIQVTDAWRAYRALRIFGYAHWNVNHSRTFVNPQTGMHTQDIESFFFHLTRFNFQRTK